MYIFINIKIKGKKWTVEGYRCLQFPAPQKRSRGEPTPKDTGTSGRQSTLAVNSFLVQFPDYVGELHTFPTASLASGKVLACGKRNMLEL